MGESGATKDGRSVLCNNWTFFNTFKDSFTTLRDEGEFGGNDAEMKSADTINSLMRTTTRQINATRIVLQNFVTMLLEEINP